MSHGTLNVDGKEFVIIAREEYERLKAGGGEALPALPAPDREGNVPAVEYARMSLARKLIVARREAGLSQAELARRAGVRPETINRLEKGRHTPDAATFRKIERALRRGAGPRNKSR